MEDPPGRQGRLHFLDWLRVLMVTFVVYAHCTLTQLPGGIEGELQIDDREFNLHDPNVYGVRWVSLGRPWCLPCLFWVSGAAAAASTSRSPTAGTGKLLMFSAVGMASNAIIWFLGPQKPECTPGSPCKGEGVLITFTVAPWTGTIFPIVFQMWYTLALLMMSLLNSQFFSVLRGQVRPPYRWHVCFHWGLTMMVYSVLALASREDDEDNWRFACVMSSLAVLEAVFVYISLCASSIWRPARLKLRWLHYCLGLITVLEVGAIPYASEINAISAAFGLYLAVGMNKFYQLGFLMLHPRFHYSGSEDVEGIVSKNWPLAVFLLVLLAPSTNWYRAGNLTFPYYVRPSDRCHYLGGTLTILFMIDRCGRWSSSEQMPSFLGNGALLLYLLHPAFMALLILAGVRNSSLLWLLCAAISVLAAFLMSLRQKSAVQRSTGYGAAHQPLSGSSVEEE